MDNTNVIEAIKSGSRETIQKVYTDNAKDVYEFTNSLVQDSARAKEVTRIAFVNLFKKINAGETPDDLRMAVLKQAYEEAQPYISRGEPAESVDIADEIEEITEQVNNVPEEYAAEADESVEAATDAITAAESAVIAEENEDFVKEPEQPEANIENSADMAEAIKARLSEDAEKEAVAARDKVAAEAYDDAEDVENIVLEEDVELVQDEPQPVYYEEPKEEKSVHHTQVIDISEAPEESDLIIAEAEEEYERGEYEDEYDIDFDDDEYDDDYDDEYDDEKPKKKGFFTVLVIINIILILLLLWLLAGLLVNLSVLPENLDLGYSWFNETIFPIF